LCHVGDRYATIRRVAAIGILLGDLLSVIAVGGIVGASCAWCVDPGWSTVLAMLVGMLAGMAFALIWSPLVGIWLGAHEAMIPAMLTGMVAGMVVAMRTAGGLVATLEAALLGGAIGIGCLLFTYAMNVFLRGEQPLDREAR
jgi:hypothetical protein